MGIISSMMNKIHIMFSLLKRQFRLLSIMLTCLDQKASREFGRSGWLSVQTGQVGIIPWWKPPVSPRRDRPLQKWAALQNNRKYFKASQRIDSLQQLYANTKTGPSCTEQLHYLSNRGLFHYFWYIILFSGWPKTSFQWAKKIMCAE